MLGAHNIEIPERVISAFTLASTKGRQSISAYEKAKIEGNIKKFNSMKLKLHLNKTLSDKKTTKEKTTKI